MVLAAPLVRLAALDRLLGEAAVELAELRVRLPGREPEAARRRATRASSAATFAWSGAKTSPKLETTTSKHSVVVRQVLDVADVGRTWTPASSAPLRAPARPSALRCRSPVTFAPRTRRPHGDRARPGRQVEHTLARRAEALARSSSCTGSKRAARPLVGALRSRPPTCPSTGSILPAWAISSPRPPGGAWTRSHRSRSACGRGRSTSSSARSTSSARAGRSGSRSRTDRVPSLILYGPPGSGKTTLARIIAQTTGAEFEELSAVSATVADVREVLARGARAARRRAAGARSSSSTRSTASTRPSRTRCCPTSRTGRHADRRDDREPVLRGQLGAALAHAALRARAALGRAAARGRAARRGGARRRRARVEARDRPPRRRRRAQRARHPRARGRDGRAARREPGASTSRTPRASGRSSTTRPATRTTTSSRRGSSRPARATSRRRSTTSRRCSRAARTRASSRGA